MKTKIKQFLQEKEYAINEYSAKFTRLAWLLEYWSEMSFLQKLSALSEIMNIAGQAHREFSGIVAICDFLEKGE